MTEELKDDCESRIQKVEWELDETIVDVQIQVQLKNPEEVDLESVKRENEDDGIQEYGGVCEHCSWKFFSSSIHVY